MTGRLACHLLVLPALVACAGSAPLPGKQIMVAGWDFSQYVGDSFFSLDGAQLVKTLRANYSDLDPTLGAGAEAAAFGTMHLDGEFGSTDTPLDLVGFADPFVPSSAAPGSLFSNLGAPAGVRFDCFKVLTREGQQAAFPLSMTARARAQVVFAADLGSVPELGSNWSVHFAGKSSAGSVPVGIEFSTDGVAFERFDSVDLTEVEAPFQIQLGSTRSDTAYVRLSFEPNPQTTRYQQAFLDNVAIRARLVLPPGTGSPTPVVEMSPALRSCP